MPAAHYGRRRHRVRRAALFLVLLTLLATGVAWVLHRALRPETYRPGEEHEEITEKLSRSLPEEAPEPRFTDVTAEAGLAGFESFRGDRSSQLPEDMGAGLAWGDFDRDGDDDLFLVSAGGPLTEDATQWAPCALYENLGDGTFLPAADFPELRISGMGAAWGDADGDGWPELAITGYRTLLLLRNREGRLEVDPSFPAPDGFWAAPSWSDYDRDGDLDLYVTGYVGYHEPEAGPAQASSRQYGKAVPYTLNPSSYPPTPNLLWRNDGEERFTEVAHELGVDNPEGRSLSALWHDWNDDGWPDLYVANDISDNVFYLNREGHFEEVGLEAWVADYRGAMGLTAGDWNRDGDDDLFVTHWVAQENALYDSLLADTSGREGQAPTMAFRDVAAPQGLGQPALSVVGWGTELADFDADGWLDIAVANGSTFESDTIPRRLLPQTPFLFWSRQGEHFHDLAPLSEALSREAVGRGLGVADFDLDGDLDLALIVLGEGVRLLRNDMAVGHWLELRLRDESGGPAPGARVIATVGGIALRRSVGGASYLSQSSATLHFGLGSASEVAAIEVRWPDGTVESFPAVAGDACYELAKGSGEAQRVELPGRLDERQRLARFWELQRAGMDALKRDDDPQRAEGLFWEALRLDPRHEDARFYLANALAVQGRGEEALTELELLQRVQPMSHRAFLRAGALRALLATSPEDLVVAEAELERAREINQEETGGLQLLGEVDLLLGRKEEAQARLLDACRTNPRAVGAFFLRGFLAWEGGDEAAARQLLAQARAARGEEWKPAGAVAEGDVAERMHREASPLSGFWEHWDGGEEPAVAFGPLADHLRGWSARTSS